MRKLVIGAIVAVMVLGVAHDASAQVISIAPTQDVFINEQAPTTNHNATGGLQIKGQTGYRRVSIIEFVIPDVELDPLQGGYADLNLCHVRSWSQGVTWLLRIHGKQDSFANHEHTETSVTWNNRGDLVVTTAPQLLYDNVVMAGGTSGSAVLPPQWHQFDITDFFNANRGQTVLFILRNPENDGAKGGTVEDREGSREGDPARAPYISYVVPEPMTALLLLAGLPMLRRRRA